MQTKPPGFSDEESHRYSRNALLAAVGWKGQGRWRDGKVLVVGAGGLGSAALLYLAAAGVGRLGIVDGDAVELSNLQRQILHVSADLGRRKAASAEESLAALNPHCRVETFDLRLDAANIREVARSFEVVVDASDNFATRFLLADYCWQQWLPLVSAAATGWQGQLLVQVRDAANPCFRCLFPEAPSAEAVPPSSEAGILGAVAGTMGCLQAVETLKMLLGRESDLTHKLLAYDGLQGRFQSLFRVKRPDCPLCRAKK
ncbi:MAG: HesA/MoeB/ThiF family protein [Deltaproteobacteria bacterium]|nr:HesA/MoeB/ThiF family protein [Deltaproteobacteria bacterium]